MRARPPAWGAHPAIFKAHQCHPRPVLPDAKAQVRPHGRSLSADAVPYLVPLLTDSDPEVGAEFGPWLHLHLDRLERRQRRAGWASYHLAISRAYRGLALNRSLIESFDLPDSYWVARYD